MMNLTDVQEFRTTWNNELFQKNKLTVRTAKRLIRKSVVIVQIRACRQLKYIENELARELEVVQRDRQILKSSLAEHLQERLKVLQKEIMNYKSQMKNRVQQEKDYWKQFEQTMAKRINLQKPPTNPLTSSSVIRPNTRPIVVVNATFVMHVDQNNENLPPLDSQSPVKISKIRKKKRCKS